MSLKYPWVCLEEEVTPWLLIRTTAGCATDVSLRAAEQWQMLFHKRCSGPIENKSSHKRDVCHPQRMVLTCAQQSQKSGIQPGHMNAWDQGEKTEVTARVVRNRLTALYRTKS